MKNEEANPPMPLVQVSGHGLDLNAGLRDLRHDTCSGPLDAECRVVALCVCPRVLSGTTGTQETVDLSLELTTGKRRGTK